MNGTKKKVVHWLELANGRPTKYYRAQPKHYIEDKDLLSVVDVLASVVNYPTIIKWIQGDVKAYRTARKLRILDEVCQHMLTPGGDMPLDNLLNTTQGYASRTAWRNKEPFLSVQATNYDWLDKIDEHIQKLTLKVKRRKSKVRRVRSFLQLTLLQCMASAAKYTSKSAWKKGHSDAYCSAMAGGWLGIVSHKPKEYQPKEYQPKYTKEEVIASASKYSSRGVWRDNEPKMHDTARNYGWFEECCKNMVILKKQWTIEEIKQDALMYETKSEWFNNSSAYAAAQKKGMLDNDDIVGHMIDGLLSDNDAVYIWQAVDQYHQGLPVYKIGITSARLGDRRIKTAAQKRRFKYKIIVLTPVVEQATSIEKELLKLGTNPGYVGGDGASEFRALTDLDLAYAVSIIRANAPPIDLDLAA